jgi:hypothetical protein
VAIGASKYAHPFEFYPQTFLFISVAAMGVNSGSLSLFLSRCKLYLSLQTTVSKIDLGFKNHSSLVLRKP